MPTAKYQPIQDGMGATSPRVLYAGENVGPAQLDTGFFPFIRSSKVQPTSSTEGETQMSPVESRQVSDRVRTMLTLPRFPDPDYRLQLLQQWECVVRSVSADELVAVLHDLTDRAKAEEEATFPLEEVPDSDRAFVEPGAVFYWSIGYRTSSTGQKDRVSQLRFRRLPTWTASERREADREALEFEELLSDGNK